jgi:hypothetical protein
MAKPRPFAATAEALANRLPLPPKDPEHRDKTIKETGARPLRGATCG